MRKEDGLTPAEREFERALAGLQPAGTSIDRDELMYRAGYAAGHRPNRLWQGATVVMAAALAASLALQVLAGKAIRGEHSMQTALRQVKPLVVPATMETPQQEALPGSAEPTYLLLRNEVLQRGLAALPEDGGKNGAVQPVTLRELLGGAAGAAAPARIQQREPTDDLIQPGGRS